LMLDLKTAGKHLVLSEMIFLKVGGQGGNEDFHCSADLGDRLKRHDR